MNVFSTKMAVSEGTPPDSTKHVNFTYGMVLGVDDFTQEFSYLSSHDQWICRDLIGYGTVSGLDVTIEPDAKGGPRVVVGPGVGVTPRGELVRVALAQCASLNEWLAGSDQVKHLQQNPGPLSPPSDRIDLYVTLCYRGCPTDKVPIPGEPCRTEDEVTAPSRLMDDFKLELRWNPPAQPDEAALRDFVEWLSRIPIVDGASSLSVDGFMKAIREAAFLIGSPPASPPDFMYGAPPAGLQIGRQDACRYLRAAYRVWATQLRPKWGASWWGAQSRCSDGRPPEQPIPEECLLLARLDVPLIRVALPPPATWRVSDSLGVTVDQELRPFLVPLRMLQEWLWCGVTAGGGMAASSTSASAFSAGAGIAAAGSVVVGAGPSGPYQLEALTTGNAGEVKVKFAAPPAGFEDVVTATPKSGVLKHPRIEFKAFDVDGFILTVKDNVSLPTPASLAAFEFMVVVTRFAK